MGLKARFLADKSAYTADEQSGRRRLANLIATRQVATCGVTELEILFSARGKRHYAEIAEERRHAFEQAPIDRTVVARALDVQRELARRGRHRAAGAADLIVAATAELAGLTLLHCDRDFDEIEAVTGQPTQLIARPPSVQRKQPYVVLTGREDAFVVTAIVEAASPHMAVEQATSDCLIHGDEANVVAVPQRHWRPEPADSGQ